MDAWEGNQELNKPDPLNILTSLILGARYQYFNSAGIPIAERGLLVSSIQISSRYVSTHYESMSFIARSRSKALGAAEGVNGTITIPNNINIGEGSPTNLGRVRADHSGEFSRNIQQLQGFYGRLGDIIK